MKLSFKMYIVMIIGIFIIAYQYHLSNAWLISNTPQVKDINVDNRPEVVTSIKSPNTKDDAKIIKSTTLPNVDKQSQLNNTTRQNTTNLTQKKNLTHPEDSTIKINNTNVNSNITKNNNTVNDTNNKQNLPPLYIITPTYRRPEQLAELTRMSHTLMLVPNIYWLVVEDAKERTPLVTNLLNKTGLKFEHLVAPMPEVYKNRKGYKPRGVSNRNRGLEWLKANATTGVFYFADDDNTYDLEIFEEMRYTKKVSMWPVGLITNLGISSPIVKDGKFIGFYDGWIAGRKFPVDMAGFAVSVQFFLSRPKAIMPFRPGYEEDGFLKSLAPFEPKDIELLASNCTKVLAWHTQTKKNQPSNALDMKKYNNTNLVLLKQIIV